MIHKFTCEGVCIVTPVSLVWYTNLPLKVDILSHFSGLKHYMVQKSPYVGRYIVTPVGLV